MNRHYTSISRRTFVTSSFFLGFAAQSEAGAETSGHYVRTASLAGGIEVRDYRIFPTPDVRRFIVEIHNTTNEAIDIPALIVSLGHLPAGENQEYAMPYAEVLQPHTSGVLFGVAPPGLKTDADWGEPQWSLCNEITNERAQLLNGVDMDITSTLHVLDEGRPLVTAILTNQGAENHGRFSIYGMVRAANGRVCGVLKNLNGWHMKQGEEVELNFGESYFTGHIGSPFFLVESADGIDVSLFIQPRPQYNPLRCTTMLNEDSLDINNANLGAEEDFSP